MFLGMMQVIETLRPPCNLILPPFRSVVCAGLGKWAALPSPPSLLAVFQYAFGFVSVAQVKACFVFFSPLMLFIISQLLF